MHSFEAGLLDYVKHNTKVIETLENTGILDDKTENELLLAVEDFHYSFLMSEGLATEAEGDVEAERTQETIVRGKRG